MITTMSLYDFIFFVGFYSVLVILWITMIIFGLRVQGAPSSLKIFVISLLSLMIAVVFSSIASVAILIKERLTGNKVKRMTPVITGSFIAVAAGFLAAVIFVPVAC